MFAYNQLSILGWQANCAFKQTMKILLTQSNDQEMEILESDLTSKTRSKENSAIIDNSYELEAVFPNDENEISEYWKDKEKSLLKSKWNCKSICKQSAFKHPLQHTQA